MLSVGIRSVTITPKKSNKTFHYFVGLGSPIKGQVKRKNTSPCKKNIFWFIGDVYDFMRFYPKDLTNAIFKRECR